MRTIQYVISICFVFLSCRQTNPPNDTNQEDPTEIKSSWIQVEAEDGSKPVARHEAAFVRVGSKFYLLGGRGIRPVSIYDTEMRIWAEGSAPPLELHHFQPVVYEGKIYIVGAMTGGWPDEVPAPHIYIYDPAMDQWIQGDEIPPERQRGSTGNVLSGGKIYVLCGIKNGHIGDHKNWVDSYDPSTSEWVQLADAPRARDHFQAVLAGGRIFALAGRTTGATEDPFGSTVGPVDSYDIELNTWTTVSAPLPTPRAGNAAILYEDAILVLGGESSSQEKAHAEVEALDLETNAWYNLPSLIEGRHGTGVLEYEGHLYIASGCGNRGGNPELSSMEKLVH